VPPFPRTCPCYTDPMPSVPLTSVNNAYLLDNAGEYVVADTTTPNGPLVTANASLTSNARHVISRSGNTVVACVGRLGYPFVSGTALTHRAAAVHSQSAPILNTACAR